MLLFFPRRTFTYVRRSYRRSPISRTLRGGVTPGRRRRPHHQAQPDQRAEKVARNAAAGLLVAALQRSREQPPQLAPLPTLRPPIQSALPATQLRPAHTQSRTHTRSGPGLLLLPVR